MPSHERILGELVVSRLPAPAPSRLSPHAPLTPGVSSSLPTDGSRILDTSPASLLSLDHPLPRLQPFALHPWGCPRAPGLPHPTPRPLLLPGGRGGGAHHSLPGQTPRPPARASALSHSRITRGRQALWRDHLDDHHVHPHCCGHRVCHLWSCTHPMLTTQRADRVLPSFTSFNASV